MAAAAGLTEIITQREPLAPHTSFNLGGPARWLARPKTLEQLVELTRRCRDRGVPQYTLGRGANLLINDDGVEGMVVRLDAPAFKNVQWGAPGDDGHETVTVTAGGGVDVARLAREAVRRGLAGLECLGGIPGTLGGCLRMNAGGRFGQIADVVRELTVVDPDGNLRALDRGQAGFRYRDSDIGAAIIWQARLALARDNPVRLRERFMNIWMYKKKSQPLAEYSAGCVFKNPPNASAGALIDRAGLKGRRLGGACVSPQHANFIVAREGATARDVLQLIGLVRNEVAERFGVSLELEIELWGRRARQPAGVA